MQVGTPLVAYGEAPELVQPGEGALNHPAVPSQPLAALNTAPGDTGLDAAGAALAATTAVVIAFVGVQLVWALPRPSAVLGPHTRHRVQRGRQHHAVVAVGPAQRDAERRALGIGDDVAFRAWFAAVRRVGPDLRTPLFARRLALSRAARRQSKAPASCSRSSSTRCSPVQTPAACHSPSLRQHVLPQQPSSIGNSCHWMPVRNTNRMPASAARFDARGRPPFGFSRSGGSSGSTTAHRSSGTSNAMPPQRGKTGFVPNS